MYNYLYTTLITKDLFIIGANNLYYSWQKFNHKYPFIAIVTDNLSMDSLSRLCMPYKLVPYKSVALQEFYTDIVNKFYLYDFKEYDKVMFLDADTLVLNNLDNLFDTYAQPTFIANRCLSYLCIINPNDFKSTTLIEKCQNLKVSEERIFRLMYSNPTHIMSQEAAKYIMHIAGQPKYWLRTEYQGLNNREFVDSILFLQHFYLRTNEF